MNTQRGFISLGVLLLIILGAAVIGGGAYYAAQNQTTSILPPQEQASTTTPNSPTPSCAGRDHMAPYILSIMPNSGPAGSKVTISGCNLSGFEGDLNATFVRNDGVTLPLYGGTYYRKVIDAAEPVSMTVTVKTYCPTGSEVGLYSGKDTPCKTVEATPGTYAVSVATPEGKSNAVTFTVK